MKRLFLLRHAKAISAGAEVEDITRALSARGRDDAVRMGRYLKQNYAAPDMVLCSPSQRTSETWQFVLRALADAPAAQSPAALYDAPSESLLAMVRAIADDTGSALIVGHNPGIADLAVTLAARERTAQANERLSRMRDKFPTGALAVLDFDTAHWRDVAPAAGTLTDFAAPRDL